MKALKILGKLFKAVPGSTIVSEAKEAVTAIRKSKDYSKLIHFVMYLAGVILVYWLITKGLDVDKIKEIFELVNIIL